MKKYWDDSQHFEQPSGDLLKKNAGASIAKQRRNGKEVHPIIVSGRKITKTWWGNAWCENLERYADYESRLERGKRYVRTGTVVDLQIKKGKIEAKVQGRRKTPYKVEIRISPLNQERCQKIIEQCSEKIESMEGLLAGNFPLAMKEVFMDEGGLFPELKEISFNCSCPDWALMCKHVAAALYGVGVRLDENPALFFELRGISMEKFIDVALENRVETMLANAQKPSSRIMEDDVDIKQLFGVL